jgi:hypothetical protein
MHGTCVFAVITFLKFRWVLQNRPVNSLIHHILLKSIISLIYSWLELYGLVIHILNCLVTNITSTRWLKIHCSLCCNLACFLIWVSLMPIIMLQCTQQQPKLSECHLWQMFLPVCLLTYFFFTWLLSHRHWQDLPERVLCDLKMCKCLYYLWKTCMFILMVHKTRR